jgi:hypothetical protein
MSRFHSPVEKIRQLELDVLPSGKPMRVEKAIRVGGVTVFLGRNGKLYATGIKKRSVYLFGRFPWQESMMEGLYRLGAITKRQRDQHLRAVKRSEEAKAARYGALEFERLAERMGIKLTKAQQNRIDAAVNRGGAA